MWHTPDGQRVIDGAEGELIRSSIYSLMEQLVESVSNPYGDCLETGIKVFDELQMTQKLALIEKVATFLLTDTNEPLPLTAVNEAVVGAIFENIRQHVEMEVTCCTLLHEHLPDADEEDFFHWRRAVLDAEFATLDPSEIELLQSEGFQWPTVDCCELERWDELIEGLADHILWDRDYEMADSFLDDEPQMAAARKEVLGIDADYFVDLPPDTNDDCIDKVITSIEALVRSKPR